MTTSGRMRAGLALRVGFVAVLDAGCFVVAQGLAIGPYAASLGEPQGGLPPPLALPLVSLLETCGLAYLVLNSRWTGWRLAGAIFAFSFGVRTLITQLETAVFPAVSSRLPDGVLPGLFLAGFVEAVLFAPMAVVVLGKWRSRPARVDSPTLHRLSIGGWLWRLALISASYEMLYFAFGYFVAWRTPAVQAYYGGTDPGSFWLQMASVFDETPWLPAYQILRSLLWVGVTVPVIRMLRAGPVSTALAVAANYVILTDAMLLFPNPIMPPPVAMTHLLETAPSNFLFGLVVVGVLVWRPMRRARQNAVGALTQKDTTEESAAAAAKPGDLIATRP